MQNAAISKSCLTIDCLLWAALLDSLTGSLQTTCMLRIDRDARRIRCRLANLLALAEQPFPGEAICSLYSIKTWPGQRSGCFNPGKRFGLCFQCKSGST